MPASIDIATGTADYAMDAPLGFRRQPKWFLSFLMGPFKDIDGRTTQDDESRPRRAKHARR